MLHHKKHIICLFFLEEMIDKRLFVLYIFGNKEKGTR